jgi:hypothetical protein
MSLFSKCGRAAIALSALALLATTSPVAAQTPSTTYKNIYGDDCVEDYALPDDGGTSYVKVEFQNTCGRAFTVNWYVNGTFRGTVIVMPYKSAAGTILRADKSKMTWTFEPAS